MKFEDVIISLDGQYVYATQVSIVEGLDFLNVRSLGEAKSYATIASKRPEGSLDVSFYIHGDGAVNSAITGMISEGPKTIKIDQYGSTGAYLESYSFSAQPNSLIEANATFKFFEPIDRNMVPDSTTFPTTTFMHGGKSQPSVSMFNDNLYSFQYNISRSIEPNYLLGGVSTPEYIKVIDTQIQVNIEGSGIGSAIEYPCSSTTNVQIILSDLCSQNSTVINVDDMSISNSSISITPDRDTVGSVSLIKYL